MSHPPISLRAEVTLNAPLALLWPLLSDTDRVNRLIGLPVFEQTLPDTALTRIVQGHYMGWPVSWREYPFEWMFEQWFRVERRFLAPFPIDRMSIGTWLTPLDAQRTRVELRVELTAHNLPGVLAARLVIGRKLLRDCVRVYHLLEQTAVAAGKVVPPPPRRPVVHSGRLQSAADRLVRTGIAPALVDRLTEHLREADDPDVLRMRPFALADRWGEDRLAVLRLFLHATRSGLLDLEWDVLCPDCRGASVRASTLTSLPGEAHCDSCNIRYDFNFDESVELRFSVSEDIRSAVDASFCIGGPASTRHVLTQVGLPPGATKELVLRLEPGTYNIRSRQFGARASFQVVAGASAQQSQLSFSAEAITGSSAELAPGSVMLTLENTSDVELLVALEQNAWSAQAVSAAFVTALSEFRQLFSSEVLAPGLGISVRNLAFLFSDLKGSTMIYDTIGDSPAYARVRDHFAVMQRIIADWRGSLVKTIGDAVMAVFANAEDAMEAAIAIQREFITGEIARGQPALRVKLGLHRGPCIVVNANETLDYFGSTVNVAARVQNESVGGDIVLTSEMYDDPGVREALERAAPVSEAFERELRGFSRSFTLHRLWLQECAQLAALARG